MDTCKWYEDRFKETSTFIQNKVVIPSWRSFASTVPVLRGSYPVRLARAFTIIFSGRYHPELGQVALALALTVRSTPKVGDPHPPSSTRPSVQCIALAHGFDFKSSTEPNVLI
ncbi:hypothetical protein CF319_g8710 [Tilletia indica]|nr:hypothetical protein CF319_g8710 [Tilletia indica]